MTGRNMYLPQKIVLCKSSFIKFKTFQSKIKWKSVNQNQKFCFSTNQKRYYFSPKFSFSSGHNLEVIEQTRLLGKELATDIRWSENTKSIYKKGMSKMWLLRMQGSNEGCLPLKVVFHWRSSSTKGLEWQAKYEK